MAGPGGLCGGPGRLCGGPEGGGRLCGGPWQFLVGPGSCVLGLEGHLCALRLLLEDI